MKEIFFMPIGPITFPPDLLVKFTPLRGALLGFGILLLILALRLLLATPRRNYVAKLGGLRWKRNQFCRGWLITGDTGSGKTSSGINQLAHPTQWTDQSESDVANPMIAQKGHMALIVPNYARRLRFSLRGVGIFEYLGDGHWKLWAARSGIVSLTCL